MRVLNLILIALLWSGCSRPAPTTEGDANVIKVTNDSSSRNHNAKPKPVRIVNDSSLSLSDIFDYIRTHLPEDTIKYKKTKAFKDFDFSQFAPIEVERSKHKDGLITAFYNDKDEMVKISKSSKVEGNNLEFSVVHNDSLNYKALIVYEFNDYNHQNGRNWIDGFILIYKNRCYFFGENKFDHAIVFKSAKQFSSIMLLDRHLKVERTLQFYFNECLYKSEVKYKNAEYLYSEKLFKPKTKWMLSDSTLFKDIDYKLQADNRDYVYWKESRIGVEEYANFPLWVFGGNHDHYPDGEN